MSGGAASGSLVVGICSARPDGATTVAVGLAGVAAAGHRALDIDANLERAEVARLLDLAEAPGIYELAYNARLEPVSGDELEAHVQWRDAVGVLPGVSGPEERAEITNHFMAELLQRAAAGFDRVFVDFGRPSERIAAIKGLDLQLWVVCPTPLGLAAFDTAVREQGANGTTCRSGLVVLNKVSAQSFQGMDRFIERRYGMRVVGELPWAPDYWRNVETSHSIRALCVPLPDARRFKRAYGAQAHQTREALLKVASRLGGSRDGASRAVIEG